MAALSFLNFNFELMRPECAGEFGALQKVQVAVYIPLFAAVVIAVYVLVKVVTLSSGSVAHPSVARARRSRSHQRPQAAGTGNVRR